MRFTNKTSRLVMAALMTALVVVMAQLSFYIGPVPFSMALFGVFFAGAMLPPGMAAVSIGVYLVLGLAGLPVFSQFRAGPQVLLGPTGGYLAGYFVAALATALGVKYLRNFALQLLAAFGGLAGCYALGTAWFVVLTGSGPVAALTACVFPFALPDAIKIIVALSLARMLQGRLRKAGVMG